MQCLKCHAESPDGAKFCVECGYTLSTPDNACSTKVIGSNGEITIHDGVMTIEKKGILTKNVKTELPLSQIKHIQLKDASMLKNGFIRFIVEGHSQNEIGVTKAAHDDFSVVFTISQRDRFKDLHRKLTGMLPLSRNDDSEIVNSNDKSKAELNPLKPNDTAQIKSSSNKDTFIGCAAIFVIILISLFCLYSCGSDKKETSSIPATSETKQVQSSTKVLTPPPEQTPLYSLGMTADQFKEKFNSINDTTELGLTLGSFKFENGPVQDTLKYAFSENLYLTGVINKKDASLRSVSLLWSPSKSDEENMKFFICMGLLIGVFNPELTPTQRGTILKEFGFTDKVQDWTKINKTIVRGNKQYSCNFIKSVGFWFTISDIDDK